MPSGDVHYRYWKAGLRIVIPTSGIVFAWGVAFNSYVAEFAIWFLFWYWMGRYADPDWDLLGVTGAEGRIQRELGLVAVFALPVTTFYAAQVAYITKVFNIKGAIGGSHRTWLTHSPIGTLHRCVLICLSLLTVINWANFLLGQYQIGVIAFHPYDLATFMIAMIAGLGVSDSIHIILDKLHGGD
jgi:hypothetical protein